MTSGRVPAAPSEAIVFGAQGAKLGHMHDGTDIGTPATPRALGTRFRPVCYRGSEFTVVGLADPGAAGRETIWLTQLPGSATSAAPRTAPYPQRATAFLNNIAAYNKVIGAVAATGVRWRAVRIRAGAVDTTWHQGGYDYAIPAFTARLWGESKPGAPLHLSIDASMMRCAGSDWSWVDGLPASPPVPARELRVVYDGATIPVGWREVGGDPAGDVLMADKTYWASIEVPRREGRHAVSAFRNGRLIFAVSLEHREPK